MSKRAPIYHAGRASVVCSLALLDGHFHEKWAYVIVGANFFIEKGRKEKEKRALYYIGQDCCICLFLTFLLSQQLSLEN
jgi:hypothetical protein